MTASRSRQLEPARGARQEPPERTEEQEGHARALSRGSTLVQLDRARASTGLLPGPLPAHDVEPDPATGVTEQGAT